MIDLYKFLLYLLGVLAISSYHKSTKYPDKQNIHAVKADYLLNNC